MKNNNVDKVIYNAPSVKESIKLASETPQEETELMLLQEALQGKDKDLNDFLTDVQEEIMDALLYIQAARHCLRDEVEECMINRMNIIGQNGNDGLHYEEEEL